MKLSILKFLFVTVLLGSGVFLLAFSSEEPVAKNSFLDYSDCELTESHVETVDTWVIVPDGEAKNLHEFDKLNISRNVEQYQVNRCVNSRKEVNTERLLLNTDKPTDPWKPQVTRIVKDERGVKIYDNRSKLVSQRQASSKSNEERSKLASNLSSRSSSNPVFPLKITPSEITTKKSRSNNNAKLIQLDNGNIVMSTKTLHAQSNKENVVTIELKSIGNDQYVPSRIQEKRFEVSSFSGVCLEYITTTSFSDYTVNDVPLRTSGR